MLRQALDAAEGRQYDQTQQQQHHEGYHPTDESSSLLTPQGSEAAGYGAAQPMHGNDYDDDDDDEDDEDDDDDEDGSGSMEDSYGEDDEWSHGGNQQQHPLEIGVAEKAWNAVRNGFMLVANVNDLWDSPGPYQADSSYNSTPSTYNSTPGHRRRSLMIVLFWFFILAGAYASERSTFKLLVDKAGPFRLFSVEMVTGAHAMMLGMWLAASNLYQRKHQEEESNASSNKIPLGIPLVDVGYMALLDTFHLLMVFLTGRYVCPTLTVILVQFTLPLSALLTQFVHSDGHCSNLCCRKGSDDSDDESDDEETAEERRFGSHHQAATTGGASSDNHSTGTSAHSEGVPLPGWGGLSVEHLWGSLILSLAVILALIPSFYSIADPDYFVYADSIPMRTSYNTLLYVSSCFPAAASQLYKEHVFLQNKQPVNASYLNFLLSLFQFILASVMAPLVFQLQGMGAGEDWSTLYPSSHFSKNFLSGLKCFLGLLPEDLAESDFPEPASCDFSLGLVLLHAFSIIAVGCAVDKIVNAGATKAMYRGVSAGIIVAVLLMHEYDMHIPRFNYGPAIDALNLVSLIILVIGAEVYHRVSLSDSVFETEYPALEGIYEDEE